ncbi:MAG: PHP domain-containing protein [Phycisphaeraceae bacterium]|nr:PHP domain-containing protein [Phycisphaeraceae bacterium]
MSFCDLHCHSTASDGTDTPSELASKAKNRGIAALALTDHDTMAGIEECRRACDQLGLEFVPGVELSANPGDLSAKPDEEPVRGTLHILGLFIDANHPTLHRIAGEMLLARRERHAMMLEKLAEAGIELDATVFDLLEGVPGRVHLANALVEQGFCQSIKEAFGRYVGRSGKAFIRRDRLSARDAIDAIHEAGGLAVLAHPVQLRCGMGRELEERIDRLQGWGLDGLEVWHPDHGEDVVKRLLELCERFGLMASGGSDYHGSMKPGITLNHRQVPISFYETLRKSWERRGEEEIQKDI